MKFEFKAPAEVPAVGFRVTVNECSKISLYNYFVYMLMGNLDVLKFIYSDTSYNGWVQLWGWDDTGSRLDVFRGADRVSDIRGYDFGKNDVYISKNILKRANKRGSEQLFAFANIVCDVDIHIEGMTVQQIEAATDALKSAILDRVELCPSCIVESGRGLQVWYCLKPVAAAMGWLYDIAQNKIFDMVRDLIADEGLELEVDEAVKDWGRVVRLPGSWNYHVQKFGSWQITGERYELMDIVESLGGLPDKPKKIERKYKIVGNYNGLCWKQKRTIERLCKTRSSMLGIRNKALYLYGAAVFQIMDQDAAADAMRSLNDYSSMGLKNREVQSVINHYIRHGVKKHSKVETFFRDLKMTAEEIAEYYTMGVNQVKAQEARDRKAARNEQILKYWGQGYNKSQIAEVMGLARGTVHTVIQRMKAAAAVVVSKAKETGRNGLRAAVQFFGLLKEFNEMGEVAIDLDKIELPLMDVLELLTARGSPPLALTG